MTGLIVGFSGCLMTQTLYGIEQTGKVLGKGICIPQAIFVTGFRAISSPNSDIVHCWLDEYQV
jgi:hypothetical protein